MNLIRFKVTVRTADGTRVPLASGMVRAAPSQLIVVPGDPDEMVPKTEVWCNLVDGYAELTLDAPSASWCWWIRVLNAHGRNIASGYYTFIESVDPLDFPRDLIEVDPSTLQPAQSAVPAWEAAVSAVEGYAQAAARAVEQVGETIATEVQDWLDANPPTAGDDGREVEFGLSATHVQWRYVGDVAWTDLIALSSLVGATGATPELQVTATHLQWRAPGGTWADLVALADLRGPQGDPGREVELQNTATHVQWRLVGDVAWIDLVALAALRGDDGLPVELRTNTTHVQWRLAGGVWADLILLSSLKGVKGDAGPAIELTTSATHVQWRVAGTLPWTDLILLSALKGVKGDAGAAVELQKTATHVQWRLVGGVWANLIALSDLKGVKGDAGAAVELQKSATHVQWRVSGTLPWTDLVPLADLKGVKGDPATNPALTAAATTLAPAAPATAVLTGVYPNLTVTFGIPQGTPGSPGTPATQVEMQASATHLQWRLVGGTWADLVTLEALKGGPGPEGPSGQAGSYVGVKTVTGATYTVLATDVGWLIRYTSASPVTITLPNDTTAAIADGKTIDHAQRGAGSLTFVVEAGAQPLIVADTAVTRKLGSMATTIKEAANTWSAVGDLV